MIFCHISRELLDHCRSQAGEMGVAERCSLMQMPADDLGALADSCVDAVTKRSVMIYVGNERRAFEEMRRATLGAIMSVRRC